ncbi:MAG TPA: galactokinase [Bryobacteraceae bacterium]|jgi:galactokinase
MTPEAEPTRTFRAPGRVNLIGEHTDYNQGFVLPVALDLGTTVTIENRPGRVLTVRSETFGDQVEFDLTDPDPRPSHHWSDYVRGVAVMLQRTGIAVSGANLVIRSEIPLGAGLSSSAALEVATARALLDASGATLAATALAKLCQQAENEFVGVQCGIMDQFTACHGTPGEALLLDCRSLAFRRVPLPPEARVVICNSMVKHSLASSEYNRRRHECSTGAQLLNVAALRDATLATLERHHQHLDATIYRRCRHVITENTRVQQAFDALQRRDLHQFGAFMYASHASLRDDFEVSCPELDLLVQIASDLPGVYGSRLTGGGFGGCTVSLVRSEHSEAFRETLRDRYREATGIEPELYQLKPPGSSSSTPQTRP